MSRYRKYVKKDAYEGCLQAASFCLWIQNPWTSSGLISKVNSIIIGAMVSHTTLEWYTRTVSVLEPLVVIIHLEMP